MELINFLIWLFTLSTITNFKNDLKATGQVKKKNKWAEIYYKKCKMDHAILVLFTFPTAWSNDKLQLLKIDEP